MKEYDYKKVDAFTSKGSMGNPAAFLMLHDAKMSDEQFLAIGREHAGFVSEVVFCTDSDRADYKLTYYSSQCEVDFCGHGTVAAMYEVIRNDKKLLHKAEILFDTNKKGILSVYNRLQEEDAIYITAPKAQQLQVPVNHEQIAKALGIQIADMQNASPVDFIDAGLRTLIVPILKLEKEISVYPNEPCLKEFCLNNGIDIILIFCMDTAAKECFAHTRVFAPKFGYLEDPATGSGNSAFANYLIKNKMWDGSPIGVEQGGDNILYNTIKLMKQEEYILFGGRATLRIVGKYIVE